MNIRFSRPLTLLLSSSSLAKAFISKNSATGISKPTSSLFMSSSIYSLSGVQSDGSTISFADSAKGKVIYATNVASQWGATRRGYQLFESLGTKYNADELLILAFPSQEFGGQEFGTDTEISSFAASKNFPFAKEGGGVGVLMKLGSVKGDTASAIWKYMRENNFSNNSKDPRWNFSAQYLVSKSGKVSIPKNVEQEIAALTAE